MTFNVSTDRQDIHPGEYIKLIFDIDIENGFFIYSTNQEKSLSPTKVLWPDSTIFIDSSIFYEPEPKIKFDTNFEMDVGYHIGSVTLEQYFLTSKNLLQKNIINGKLFYQACDVKQCIRYYDDFELKLNILDKDKREEFSTITSTSEASNNSGNMLDSAIESGLISFIFLSFGMGLLALLTPCVFPMIPITVSFFTKQGEKENNNPLKSAIIYALGIIVIFTSLGMILAITIGASGANQIASNPWINLFIALLFVFFAFSLFGMYEIQAPSALRQFSLQKEQQQQGVVGILFMALTFTLTSFTCTVQFVGLLLVAASQGSFMWPILGMVIFSTAFSLPFFFLALFPQYLSKLPKSGQWMNSIKVTMGFLELGAAMKFFSNVDLVWNLGVFTYNMVLASWAILSILTGVYLLGKIKLPHDSELKVIKVPRLIISIFFLSFGLYLSNGLFGGNVYGLVDSYLPPKIVYLEEPIKNTKSDKVYWIQDYDLAIKESKRVNKPIFIDFTGYTCTNCRWMEVNVFVDKQVEELFDNFVLLKLYTDGGPRHKEYRQMEIDRYGTSALPFYVVIDSDENELSRFHGMDTDINKFINFLKSSL